MATCPSTEDIKSELTNIYAKNRCHCVHTLRDKGHGEKHSNINKNVTQMKQGLITLDLDQTSISSVFATNLGPTTGSHSFTVFLSLDQV